MLIKGEKLSCDPFINGPPIGFVIELCWTHLSIINDVFLSFFFIIHYHYSLSIFAVLTVDLVTINVVNVISEYNIWVKIKKGVSWKVGEARLLFDRV